MGEVRDRIARRWIFDYHWQAQQMADRLNAGTLPTPAMAPVQRSYEAGWGIKRDGDGAWVVYGRGW